MSDEDELQAALAARPAAFAEFKELGCRVDASRQRVVLTPQEVSEKPYLVWNGFISLLGALPYEEMTTIQQAASLVFFYDGEVQNGGHHQFSVNTGEDPERQSGP